jgi:NADH:ubiquinone oxidoreductase subunit F (NADH-binding)
VLARHRLLKAMNLDLSAMAGAFLQLVHLSERRLKAVTLMNKPSWDLALVAELSQVMRDASICGLGQAAPNPMDSVVKYFPQELS